MQAGCLFTADVGHRDVYGQEDTGTLGSLWMLFGEERLPKCSVEFGKCSQQWNCIKSENKN